MPRSGNRYFTGGTPYTGRRWRDSSGMESKNFAVLPSGFTRAKSGSEAKSKGTPAGKRYCAVKIKHWGTVSPDSQLFSGEIFGVFRTAFFHRFYCLAKLASNVYDVDA